MRVAAIPRLLGTPHGLSDSEQPFEKRLQLVEGKDGGRVALGVIGILSVWYRDDFWLATGIAAAIFYLGAAAVHLKAIVADRNRAQGNAGPVLYYDLLLPCAIVVLLIAYEVT